MKSTITGWGKCIPNNVVTNDDLATFIETSDEWIEQRTGIKERRFSHVNNSDMASVAGLRAIACAGLKPENIDVVILATCTPDSIVPSAAAHVQQKMGCVDSSAYDINAACAGIIYGLEQAKAFVDAIEEGEIKGGETCVFTAVGAGLSWGACALKLGSRVTPLDETDVDLPPFDGTGLDAIKDSMNYFVPEKRK